MLPTTEEKKAGWTSGKQTARTNVSEASMEIVGQFLNHPIEAQQDMSVLSEYWFNKICRMAARIAQLEHDLYKETW